MKAITQYLEMGKLLVDASQYMIRSESYLMGYCVLNGAKWREWEPYVLQEKKTEEWKR